MATNVVTGEELLGVNISERELAILINHVQQQKEIVTRIFQELISLLTGKEKILLQEMDDIVIRARHNLAGKRKNLNQLDTTTERLENNLTNNELREVLEKSKRPIEDKMGEELSRDLGVGWVELDWKREQLEQCVIEVCRVVILKERPFISEDYSMKLRPVWSFEGTGPGEILNPRQIAIDNTTQNIFITDYGAHAIQVFSGKGIHLYKIPTSVDPRGIALTEEYIFVSAEDQMLKIRKSNNKPLKSVYSGRCVLGIDIDERSNIYACEFFTTSVTVFDKNLKFVKRIKLETFQIGSNNYTHCIKLYKGSMYVMLDRSPFHIQIFSLEGELLKYLIAESEIGCSFFFSIDQLGNIIVADWLDNRIKIFSKEGERIYTLDSEMLPGEHEFYFPTGVAVTNKNLIIVAQKNIKCCLLAF